MCIVFSIATTKHSNFMVATYWKHFDFIRKVSKLLVVEVILEIDINWS